MSEYYYHFAAVDNEGVPRLRYEDGRIVEVGQTYTVDVSPVLCEAGLHASRHCLDALGYAEGDSCLCLVTLGGTVEHGGDKSVATERTVVAMLSVEDTDKLLHRFACAVALEVAHLWEIPQTVRQYLENCDDSLRSAARVAARSAAWAATWYKAGAALDALRAKLDDMALTLLGRETTL